MFKIKLVIYKEKEPEIYCFNEVEKPHCLSSFSVARWEMALSGYFFWLIFTHKSGVKASFVFGLWQAFQCLSPGIIVSQAIVQFMSITYILKEGTCYRSW